jgi:hypothetical protein
MRSRQAFGLKHQDWSPNEVRASSRLTDAAGSCEFGSGSSKAEHGPLIVPGKRQTGVREQLLCRQIARLASFDNRLGNVRGEIAEADNPSEIGSAHSFAQSKCRKGPAKAGGDKALVGNSGFRRYLKTVSAEHFAVDETRVAEDARFDGLYDRLQEIELEQDGKRFLLRTPTTGVAGKLFQAVGVALPPNLQELPLTTPQPAA